MDPGPVDDVHHSDNTESILPEQLFL
jgi:hypothetical protein